MLDLDDDDGCYALSLSFSMDAVESHEIMYVSTITQVPLSD